jgi:hypothetical protein
MSYPYGRDPGGTKTNLTKAIHNTLKNYTNHYKTYYYKGIYLFCVIR